MATKILRQKITFAASAGVVYDMLMESKKHAAFTGGSARISKKIGGSIEAYDGYITGKNIELVPGKKIVQEWRASDWPDGCMSRVSFVFKKLSSKTTQLLFTQVGIPQEFYNDIRDGWIEHYWDKMKESIV